MTGGTGEFSIGGDLWPGTSKLIEECGEVLQVCGKLIGSEGRRDHWSGDLRQMLIEELGDLAAAQKFFEVHNLTPAERRAISIRAVQKFAKFEEWHRNTQAEKSA